MLCCASLTGTGGQGQTAQGRALGCGGQEPERRTPAGPFGAAGGPGEGHAPHCQGVFLCVCACTVYAVPVCLAHSLCLWELLGPLGWVDMDRAASLLNSSLSAVLFEKGGLLEGCESLTPTVGLSSLQRCKGWW